MGILRGVDDRLYRNRGQQQLAYPRGQELPTQLAVKQILSEDYPSPIAKYRPPFVGTIEVIRAEQSEVALRSLVQFGKFLRRGF